MDALFVEDLKEVQEIHNLHLARSLALHLVVLHSFDHELLECFGVLDGILAVIVDGLVHLLFLLLLFFTVLFFHGLVFHLLVILSARLFFR